MKLITMIVLLCWVAQYQFGTVTTVQGAQQDRQGNEKQRHEVLKTEFGFPVWLVRNVPAFGNRNTNHAYAYMAPEHFALLNVQEVFFGLAKDEDSSPDFQITLYSDRTWLIRDIEGYYAISSGRSSYDFFVGRAVKKRDLGYYRAFYFRKQDGREWIEYSPDPDKEEMVWIDLKPSPQRNLNAALANAVEDGDVPMVKTLIARGAAVNALDVDGWAPLMFHRRPKLHAPEMLATLINLGADPNIRGHLHMTPLICASIDGDVEAARMLLEKGAEIDARDERGDTGLMSAAELGERSVVRFLVERGADPNLANNLEQTALMKAAGYMDQSVWSSMPLRGESLEQEGTVPARQPVWPSLDASVAALITAGAEVNATDRRGKTALIIATEHGNVTIVKQLLAAGADPNLRSNEGESPLKIALREWPAIPDLARILKRAGAR